MSLVRYCWGSRLEQPGSRSSAHEWQCFPCCSLPCHRSRLEVSTTHLSASLVSAGTVGASGLSNQAVRALHISGSSISLLTTHYLATAHVQGGLLRLRTRHLAGLNGSVIAAAAFDGLLTQRAYAVTTDLDLLLLQVPDAEKREAKVSIRAPCCVCGTQLNYCA